MNQTENSTEILQKVHFSMWLLVKGTMSVNYYDVLHIKCDGNFQNIYLAFCSKLTFHYQTEFQYFCHQTELQR